jgi:hypothetical protein
VARYPQNVKGIQILDQIVARALTDTAFRRRLLDDPKTVLRKEGLTISDDVQVAVHRNQPGLINLVLPAGPPSEARLKAGETELRELIPHHMF